MATNYDRSNRRPAKKVVVPSRIAQATGMSRVSGDVGKGSNKVLRVVRKGGMGMGKVIKDGSKGQGDIGKGMGKVTRDGSKGVGDVGKGMGGKGMGRGDAGKGMGRGDAGKRIGIGDAGRGRNMEYVGRGKGIGEGSRSREDVMRGKAIGEGSRASKDGERGKVIGHGQRGRVDVEYEDEDSDSDSDYENEGLEESDEEEIGGEEEIEGDDEMEGYDEMEGEDELEGEDEMEGEDGRAARSVCYGDYKTPPQEGEPKLGVVQFIDGKTIRQPKYKRTLTGILRAAWKYETAFQKGREREAFLNKCVKKFREYYYYPKGISKRAANSAVREHLRKSLKQKMYTWKKDADKQVAAALAKGEKADRIMFKPHFLEEEAWKGCCEYWESTGHKKMSKVNTENRKKLKFPHASGAMPFEERRMIKELETGKVLSELEMFDLVYTKKHAELMEIKEAMKRVAEEMASQIDPNEPPPSPATCRKRNALIALRARKPKKGKIFMHPNKTIQELLGPEEAAAWTNTSTPSRIPNHAYEMMGRAMNEVTDMVQAMDGIDEVLRSRFDDELRKLADGAYPSKDDPIQHVLWDQYIKIATSLATSQFERFKKVIIEDTAEDTAEDEAEADDEENLYEHDVERNAGERNVEENVNEDNSDNEGSFNNTQLSP